MNQNLTREMELYNVLRNTANTGYFTAGERILINQERGYLLSMGTEDELRPYQVNEELEAKIQVLKR